MRYVVKIKSPDGLIVHTHANISEAEKLQLEKTYRGAEYTLEVSPL